MMRSRVRPHFVNAFSSLSLFPPPFYLLEFPTSAGRVPTYERTYGRMREKKEVEVEEEEGRTYRGGATLGYCGEELFRAIKLRGCLYVRASEPRWW